MHQISLKASLAQISGGNIAERHSEPLKKYQTAVNRTQELRAEPGAEDQHLFL